MQKLKVVFFGSSRFVIPIIEVLKKNFDLALVVTTEKLPTDPIPSYCLKSKVYYYVVIDFRDKRIIDRLKKINADIAALASFGAIIPLRILNLFPKGIINIHPSLLPKYRGPSPVQAAILNGDKTTGITIIKLDEEVDHGPILAQSHEPILENDTSESLYERLFRLGSSLIVRTIKLYVKGKITPYEQDNPQATFTKSLTRQDGYIDPNNSQSKEYLDRMTRAYYPWPNVWTRWKSKIIKFYPNALVQIEGKKPVDIETFKRGYPDSINWIEKLLGQQK